MTMKQIRAQTRTPRLRSQCLTRCKQRCSWHQDLKMDENLALLPMQHAPPKRMSGALPWNSWLYVEWWSDGFCAYSFQQLGMWQFCKWWSDLHVLTSCHHDPSLVNSSKKDRPLLVSCIEPNRIAGSRSRWEKHPNIMDLNIVYCSNVYVNMYIYICVTMI